MGSRLDAGDRSERMIGRVVLIHGSKPPDIVWASQQKEIPLHVVHPLLAREYGLSLSVLARRARRHSIRPTTRRIRQASA